MVWAEPFDPNDDLCPLSAIAANRTARAAKPLSYLWAEDRPNLPQSYRGALVQIHEALAGLTSQEGQRILIKKTAVVFFGTV